MSPVGVAMISRAEFVRRIAGALREENFKTDGAATDFFDGLWEGITAQLSPRHRQGLGGGVAADAGRPFHGVLLDLRERLRVRASLWDAFVGFARENKAPRGSADYRALLSAGLIRSDDNVRYELRFDLLHRILGLPG